MEVLKPKLGSVTSITMTSPDLARSLQYYESLGFHEVMRFDFPFPWIQITDDALLIMLRLGKEPYLALTYYVSDIEILVAELEKEGIIFIEKANPGDMVKRFLIKSPDGLTISLVGMFDGFVQPKGANLRNTPPEDFFKPEKYVNKVCGLFGELAHPVKDLEASIAWWKLLGYLPLSKFTAPYPWAILSDGLGIVGIHQTTHFDYPVITYFASDMKEKIHNLKTAGIEGIPDAEIANVTIVTPEKQHINLFKMGM